MLPPQPVSHGEWLCELQASVLTCNLECRLGYAATNRTVTSCVAGDWSTSPPEMTCSPAVVLVTGGGTASVEIYSSDGRCDQLLSGRLPDERLAHSVDYVDGQVLLCGGALTETSCLEMDRSTFSWRWHSSLAAAVSTPD